MVRRIPPGRAFHRRLIAVDRCLPLTLPTVEILDAWRRVLNGAQRRRRTPWHPFLSRSLLLSKVCRQ